MSTEFDSTTLAAYFVQANAERFWTVVAGSVKEVTTHVRVRLNSTYTTYIERILDRYGKGKSFFTRSESVPLYEFFVPLNLKNQLRIVSAPAVRELTALSPLSIITGTGGSGKSIMMRHLLVSCITSKLRTPVFLELRQLNQSNSTVQEALLHVLQTYGLEIDNQFLEAALEGGQLLVLLDGFDELIFDSRNRIASEIKHLAEKYPQTWLIMSSRPDSTLQGWEAFTEYSVEPLSLEGAMELVRRVRFDGQVKERFVADMRNGTFKEHGSFLSNPLLLSIMLLTYGDVAQIPHKFSTFYALAYEALFHRHDALKGGFQRERKSGLDIQEFARAFSAFSLISYDEREFSFTYARALEVATRAGEIAMLRYDPKALVDDSVQAICLMLDVGLEITFAHRSFQESLASGYKSNSCNWLHVDSPGLCDFAAENTCDSSIF
jgi:hypothetical protein